MVLQHHFCLLNLVAERSSIPSFARLTLERFYNVFFKQMRQGVKYPFNYSFPRSRLHISIFSKLMGTFTKSLIIQFCHPGFKWLIPTHIRWLNIFCAPIWSYHAIYIHLLQIVCKGPKAKSHLLYDKAPKIHFTQQIAVSFSFIQVLPELLTAQWNLNSLSSDLNSLLVARKTTSGFNLVPSALAATHMLTIHLYAQLSSNKQILLLVY